MAKGFAILTWSIVLLIAAFIYWVYDPALYSFFPRCPLWVYTGLYCPGCGSQRALHQMATGHFVKAAGYNLLAVLYLPLIMVWYISLFKKNGFLHLELVRLVNNQWFIYGTLVMVVLFCVIRNTHTALGHQLAP